MSEAATVDDAVLERLRQASTATIATQLFKLGLRHRFLTGLAPLNPELCRFAGEATTLRYIPMREDLDHPDVYGNPEHPQRKVVETARPGSVLVIGCLGDVRAGTIGAILAARLRARGAVGLVTDGAVRDAGEIAAAALPVFAAARSAGLSLSVLHAVDFDVPIACAGVAVFPGDVLAGDEDGVVVIPRHLAAQIAAPAAEQEDLERFLLAKIETGAPLPGTYPPNAQTLAEYEAQRRSGAMG